MYKIKTINYYLIEENFCEQTITIVKTFTDKYNCLFEIESLADSYIKDKHSKIDMKYHTENVETPLFYYYTEKSHLNGLSVYKFNDFNPQKIISWYIAEYNTYVENPFYYLVCIERSDLFEHFQTFDDVLFELKYKIDIEIFKKFDIVVKQIKNMVPKYAFYE